MLTCAGRGCSIALVPWSLVGSMGLGVRVPIWVRFLWSVVCDPEFGAQRQQWVLGWLVAMTAVSSLVSHR